MTAHTNGGKSQVPGKHVATEGKKKGKIYTGRVDLMGGRRTNT